MSSPSAQKAAPSSFTAGLHGFVKTTISSNNGSPSNSSENLRPTSRGRDPSPMSKRVSSFGLKVLKKRPQQQSDAVPSLPSQDSNVLGSLRAQHEPSLSSPHLRHSSQQQPNALPLVYSNFDVISEQRGRTLPFTGPHISHQDPMSPLPLPPRIPGGIHTRNSSRNTMSSMERPESSTGSTGTGSRPVTPGTPNASSSALRPSTPSDEKGKKRRTFMGGKLHKKNPSDTQPGIKPQMVAFYLGPTGRGESYDLTSLIKGRPIPELWNPEGSLLVYLYERAPQASFRLDPSIIASSRGLQRLITGSSRRAKVTSPTTRMRHLSLGGPLSPSGPRNQRSSSAGSADIPWSPSLDDEIQDIEIRLPIMIDPDDPAPTDIADLITARNMFACLIGQLIVGSPAMPTFFSIFMSVAGMMTRFEFGNFDGSTLGEAGEAAFLGYVADLRLDDVRKSREKTIEALILGEKMKCWSLYNEAYVHAVGKWKDIIEKHDPKFTVISSRSRIAMEKSAMDLDSRIATVRQHLDDFQFHGLFAGFANSKAVRQAVDVQAWETAWKAMRKHVIAFYKKSYGNWPPKAKSKKNEFEESGLNRLLLQDVYRDFTDLYEMLVDREALTERTLDATHGDTLADSVHMDHLRKLLSEFDRSTTPVRPPIPYDLPLLPSLRGVVRDFDEMDHLKRDKELSKKLKGDNFTSVIMRSYNRDAMKTSPFIESYMAWERNVGSGRTARELENIRTGAWIFVYVVLQMLPLLVVDAPGLRHTRAVEYFLCEVPKGSPPWMDPKSQQAFFRVAETGAVVSMPTDLVEHGVEGIFKRSHCWVAASKWSGQTTDTLLPNSRQVVSDNVAYAQSPHPSAQPSDNRSMSGRTNSDHGEFAPPRMVTADGLLAASASARGSRTSLMPGLEALPMPPSIGVDGLPGSRRASTFDPTKSFDDILGSFNQDSGKTKKGKK